MINGIKDKVCAAMRAMQEQGDLTTHHKPGLILLGKARDSALAKLEFSWLTKKDKGK